MKVAKNNLKKRPRVAQQLPEVCLECGNLQGYLRQEITSQIEFKGEVLEVAYERFECSECGASVMSDEQLTVRQKHLVELYQQRHGLLTAQALIALRRHAGYASQAEFADALPGVGLATIKRIEAGQHVQDISTDSCMRVALAQALELLQMNKKLSMLREPMRGQCIEDVFSAPPSSAECSYTQIVDGVLWTVAEDVANLAQDNLPNVKRSTTKEK